MLPIVAHLCDNVLRNSELLHPDIRIRQTGTGDYQLSFLFPYFYLALCIATACLLTSRLWQKTDSHQLLSKSLSLFVLCFAIFFGGYLVLGFIDLIFHNNAVSSKYAVILAGAGFALLVFIRGRNGQPFLEVNSELCTVANSVRCAARALLRIFPILTLIIGGALLVTALGVLSGFPRGFESIRYHLPIAVRIFQDGTLSLWDQSTYLTFPANASIYYGFLLTFLPERLVSIAQLPFLLPLLAAVYGVARPICRDERGALLATLGLLSVPIVMLGARELESDICGLAFAASAVYFCIDPSETNLVEFGPSRTFLWNSLWLQDDSPCSNDDSSGGNSAANLV